MGDGKGAARKMTSTSTARQCGDGLVHYVHYTKSVKGADAPGMWLRECDGNDDFVSVLSLPMTSSDVTCVACVALESQGKLRVRDDA